MVASFKPYTISYFFIYRYLSTFRISLTLVLRTLKATNVSALENLKDNCHIFALSMGKDALPILPKFLCENMCLCFWVNSFSLRNQGCVNSFIIVEVKSMLIFLSFFLPLCWLILLGIESKNSISSKSLGSS